MSDEEQEAYEEIEQEETCGNPGPNGCQFCAACLDAGDRMRDDEAQDGAR